MIFKVFKNSKNKSYSKLFTNVYRVIGAHFVIFCKSEEENKRTTKNLKFEIIASKKIGNAIVRNNCKRIIKNLLSKSNFINFKSNLYIRIITRSSLLSENITILQNDFNVIIQRIIFNEEN